MKISTFVIAIVAVGMIVSGAMLWVNELAGNYGMSFDNSTVSGMDKTENVQNLTNTIFDDLSEIDTTSSTLDIVGGFLKSGFTVIKVTFASFGLFTSISGNAFAQVPGLAFFGSFLLAIAFIAFVFLVISILVGRDT